jgi:hypothetical protein
MLNAESQEKFCDYTMKQYRSPLLILTSVALLLPINIYYGTDWIRCGLQWGLVRYQQTVVSDQLVSFSTDIISGVSGAISGSIALSALIWGTAVFLLIAALILNIVGLCRMKAVYTKAAAGFTITAGLVFLLADIVHYGVLLHGSAEWCIPIGIPAILVLGIWGFLSDFEDESLQKAGMPASCGKNTEKTNSLCSQLGAILHNEDIIILVFVSLLVKAVVFFAGNLPNIPFARLTGDLTLYHWYAMSPFHGIYPYVSYYVPYPQFFLIPVFLALIPVITIQNPVVYLFSFSALMILVDTATLLCVYSLARRFFGRENGFLCGLLYATAIAAAFFVPISYDAVPTFFLVFSIWLFLSQKTISSYLSATAATLLKWFPAFCFPYFLLYAHKNGHDSGPIKKSLVLSALFAGFVIAPFIILNWAGFFNTYLSELTRFPETHSFVYYIKELTQFLFQKTPADSWYFVLLALGELVLLIWYFRSLDKKPLTLVYVIFASILFFVITNKVFSASWIIWLTPFLALLLVHSPRRIILFYLSQIIIYLETPVLFGIVYMPENPGFSSDETYSVMSNSLPSFPFIFYTIKFCIFFIILYVCITDLRKVGLTNDSEELPAP